MARLIKYKPYRFGAFVQLRFLGLSSVVKFKKLPKAGYWMNKIKYAFGFMLLYLSLYVPGKG